MVHKECDFLPPPGPPPLLAPEEVRHLAFQGWLPLQLPDGLQHQLSHLSDATSSFFDQPPEEKQKLYPASRGTENGFYIVENEKEYFTVRHRVHTDSDLEQVVGDTWKSAGLLLHRILCDISRAGGFSTNAWAHLLEGSLELPVDTTRLDDVVTLMRLFRYYPTGGFAAEHADLGLLTLCVGGGTGLQVLDRTQQPSKFIDVDSPVILVGETLRSLLRNRLRSGIHRVVPNPDGRSSVVFALRPCLKHPTDRSAFGGEGIVSTFDLFHGIRASKYNINATKDIREEQQKVRRGQRSAPNIETNLETGQG